MPDADIPPAKFHLGQDVVHPKSGDKGYVIGLAWDVRTSTIQYQVQPGPDAPVWWWAPEADLEADDG